MTTHNNKKHTSAHKEEGWMSRTWRPAMAWTYLIICVCDFIVFPVLYGLYSFHFKGALIQNWIPLTLQGGGMLHLSMGAILGVTSYMKGATQTAMVNNGMYQPSQYPQPYLNTNTATTSYPNEVINTDMPISTIKRPIPRIKV